MFILVRMYTSKQRRKKKQSHGRYQTGKAVNSSPAVVKGVIYFGSEDHYLHALSA